MCGRTACTLAPNEIIQACGYMKATGEWVYPRWQDPPGGRKYYPSYNLAPSLHSPILFSSKSIENPNKDCEAKDGESDWVVQPMHWGLIPHWHHGDYKSFSYKMNNARSDGLLQKASYKKPLEMGRRCVVLADGYYEWKTSKDGKKQPFFIYFPTEGEEKACQGCSQKMEVVDQVSDEGNIKVKQESNTDEDFTANNKLTDPKKKDDSEEPKEFSKVKHVFGSGSGKRLLTMAGLFDMWTEKDGETLFSYSVITVDAHPDMDYIHDRMPAILDGEEEVRSWLEYKSCPLDKALELIRPTNCLKYHPVSSSVNDSRNKSHECVQEIDLKSVPTKKLSASGHFMKSWLKSGAVESKRKSSDEAEPAEKKTKL